MSNIQKLCKGSVGVEFFQGRLRLRPLDKKSPSGDSEIPLLDFDLVLGQM